MHVALCSTAAAVLLFGGLALFLLNNSPPEFVQVAATDPSGNGRNARVQPPPKSEDSKREGLGSLREGLGSLRQRVADARVIVVATAMDSAPAPPKRPGDLPEVLIRFQVNRVLKGDLARTEITTRTPTAAAEFIGKEWIIFLSPDYMAGKHQLASCMSSKFEPTVKSYLAKDKK
jgi:hypothetical protein